MRACGNCGKSLEGAHGRRKWCCDRCRKIANYSGTCIDCGARTEGTASGYVRASVRCDPCAREVAANVAHLAAAAHREEVAALWVTGMPMREMAALLEVKRESLNSLIVRWRREGFDFPCRRVASKAGRLNQRRRGKEAAAHLARLRAAV